MSRWDSNFIHRKKKGIQTCFNAIIDSNLLHPKGGLEPVSRHYSSLSGNMRTGFKSMGSDYRVTLGF